MAKETVKTRKGNSVAIHVKAQLLEIEKDASRPRGLAYVYSQGGHLLDRALLDNNGEATLVFTAAKVARKVRVLVGPEAEVESPLIAELQRRGSVQSMLRVDPTAEKLNVAIDVLHDQWNCWFGVRCYVPGVLMKRVRRGEFLVDRPVCFADIYVYEVDPRWLTLASDSKIEKIREFILTEPTISKDVFPTPSPSLEISFKAAEDEEYLVKSDASADTLKDQSSYGLSSETRFALQTASTQQLRGMLMQTPGLVRSYWCINKVPVTKKLVATARTDECGRFTAVFYRGCSDLDTPDLYFEAKQQVNPGIIRSVYAPLPVACHTHWDYQCGTEVRLYTLSSYARICNPCAAIESAEPGKHWVAVKHIGNLPLSRIRGTSVDDGIQNSNTDDNKGLCFLEYEEAYAGDFSGRPFGGLLRLHIEFDPALLEYLGVTHYLVSWRPADTGNGEAEFRSLSAEEVHRHYSITQETDSIPYVLNERVGDQVLFRIPPAEAPNNGIWVAEDIFEQNTNAKFPTTKEDLLTDIFTEDKIQRGEHKAGKFELKIDLYAANEERDQATKVDIDELGIIYQVPEETILSGAEEYPYINAADPRFNLDLVKDDDRDGLKSFIMTVHVDNNECTAEIAEAQLGGNPANDCGVLEYAVRASSVTMLYTAFHPNGFASYSFSVKRGTKQLVPPLVQGCRDPKITDCRVHEDGEHELNKSVGELLGEDCQMAAFSQRLHVWAMATNGLNRLNYLDAGDHAAFALAPQMEDES